MRERVVYVDVDDTLVRTAGTKRMPIPRVVQQVRNWHAEGVTMYLWSTAGADYARVTAAEFGIESCFAGFLPKPDVYVDDQAVAEWRGCRHLHPNEL